MRKKNVIIILLVIVFSILSVVYLSRNTLINDSDKLYIRNGDTGELIVLDESTSHCLSEEINTIEKKFCGFCIWSAGYEYKISFNQSEEESLLIKGEHILIDNFFKYKTKTNLIELIDNYMEIDE